MTIRQYFSAVLILLLGHSWAVCQDENSPPKQTAIVVSTSEFSDGASDIMSFEVNDTNGHFLGNSGSGFQLGLGANSDSFSMLNDPSVQQDLQIVDEQLEQIKQANREFGEKLKREMELMKDETGKFNFQNGTDFGELIRDLKQQQQEHISRILLPNQQKRLEQVARQIRMKQLGTSSGLTGKLADELGITEEQREKIRDKSKELNDRLERQIGDLRAQAKKELLQELTPGQREKLTDLLGDDFIQKKEDRKSWLRNLRPAAEAQSEDS